jgi:putative ABC transport system permease protein
MNYIQTTLRTFRKNRAYSLLNIFGLAIGLACAGMIFLWVEDELSFDSNNVKKDNLYVVDMNASTATSVVTHNSTPGPLAPMLRATIPAVVNTCRTTDARTELLHVGDKAVNAVGMYAEPSIFDMFTLPFVEGNAKSAFPQLYSIVVTRKAATKFFGDDKNVVGRKIAMDNKQEYVVTGVLKDLPENTSLQFDWLVPYAVYASLDPHTSGWDNFMLDTYVEMRPGTDVAPMNKKFNDSLYDFTTNRKEASASSDHMFLFGMKDWRLRNQFENGRLTGGGRIQYIHLFSMIAWIVLFIACVNFMNLATARSERRAREVGVRKVLGAGKGSLVRQFLWEATFLALLSTIAAVFIMALVLPAFNTLVGKDLELGVLKPLHLGALLGLTLVCGVVSGSYPSLYLSSFNPVFVLKGIKLKTGSAGLIRKGLVVMQFTVSIVLIIGTIVIYLQVQHVKNRALGFDKDRLVQMNLRGDMVDRFPVIKQELLNSGFFANAALADHPALHGGNNTQGISWPGKNPNSVYVISQRVVSPEYLPTMGMHLTAGRDFESTDLIEPSVFGRLKDSSVTFHVLVTHSMEVLLGRGTAVGKMMDYGSPMGVMHMVVEGVVDDYVYGDMYGQPPPVVFYCMPKGTNLLYARVKAQSDPEQALAKMGAVMKAVAPGYPFEYTFVDDQFNSLFQSETLISRLSRVFAALAIFISCVGLFGLAAYTAESRIKEIGIRKVLGASTSGITYMLSRDFLRLTLLSCLVAFPIAAWMMSDWLRSYSYRIGLAWWVFALAGSMAVLIALATVSFQAIRAALANPVRSLRAE